MSGGTIREISTSDTEIVAASVTPADGNVVRYQWVDRVHGSGVPHQDIAGATGEGVPEMRARGKRQQTTYDLKRLAYRQIINYELTAAAASFSLAGQDESHTRAISLTADAASFTQTALDNSTALRRQLPGASYALSGQDATFTATRALSADAGSFALTGSDISLVTPANYTLSCEPGAFTLSAQTAGETATRSLIAAATSFALSGGASTLTSNSGAVDPFRTPLGVGLLEFTENSSDLPFVDVMAFSAATWTSTDTSSNNDGGTVLVDNDDWPTSLLPGQYANILMLRVDGHYEPGRYLMTWDGVGTFDIQYDGVFTSTGSNSGYFDVATPSSAGIGLSLKTTSVGNHLRNMKICMPGFIPAEVTRFTFNPVFLAAHRDSDGNCLYGSVRFMDWLHTNSQQMTQWTQDFDTSGVPYYAQRTQVSRRSYSADTTGIRKSNQCPLEVCIALANQLNAHPWLNVPHLLCTNDNTKDADIRAFGQCIQNNLNPNLVPLIETGNENWNPTFAQVDYFEALAYGHRDRDQQLALSARKTGDLVKERCPRALTIFGAQLKAGVSRTGMDYLAGIYGSTPAQHHIDILAPALYWGEIFGTAATGDAFARSIVADPNSVANIEADLYDQATRHYNGQPGTQGLIESMQRETIIANQYGLKVFAYEGGLYSICTTDPTYDDMVTWMNDFASNPLQTAQYTYMFNDVWKTNGGQFFMHYQGQAHKWDKFGASALSQYLYQVDNTNNYRLNAIHAWSAANPVYWEPSLRASQLLLPSATDLRSDGFIPTVRCTQRTGTIYGVVVPVGDHPLDTQIIAGQQSNGSAATVVLTPVTSFGSGVDILFDVVTTLSADTDYTVAFTHDNGSFTSSAVYGDVSTYPPGSGVILQIINQATALPSIFPDQSPFPKNVFAALGTNPSYHPPLAGVQFVEFDSTNPLGVRLNPDFAFGTNDFMVEWLQVLFTGAVAFRELWDFRTVAADAHLSCHTGASGEIIIRVGTSDVITGASVTPDVVQCVQLARESGQLRMYMGTYGGSMSLVSGPISFTTSFARAPFRYGKDVAGAGGFNGYGGPFRIQRDSLVGVGTFPTLPFPTTDNIIPRSDNFDRTASATTIQSPSDGLGDYVFYSTDVWGVDVVGRCYVASGTGGAHALLNCNSKDHSIQVTCEILNSSSDPGAGIVCRSDGTGNNYVFVTWLSSGQAAIVQNKDGTGEDVLSIFSCNTAPFNGDVMLLEVSGSTVSLTQNGSPVVASVCTTTVVGDYTYAGLRSGGGDHTSRFDSLSIT